MDVLSDVMQTLRFKGRLVCRVELTAPWGLFAIPHADTAQFHVVEKGGGWLSLPGFDQDVALEAGDFILVSNIEQLILRDAPTTELVPFGQITSSESKRIIRYGGDGPLTSLLCGAFQPDTRMIIQPFLKLLPPLIHVKGNDGNAPASLATILAQIGSEYDTEAPGTETLRAHLIAALFVYVMRDWIQQTPNQPKGWLAGLHDPLIAGALQAIHQAPQQAWTIEALAQQVGLSRSAFAERFRSVVGDPPLTYLARWRMQLAIGLLRDPHQSLTVIAQRVGYESVYSFSKAFKKLTGISPGRFRDQQADPGALQASGVAT